MSVPEEAVQPGDVVQVDGFGLPTVRPEDNPLLHMPWDDDAGEEIVEEPVTAPEEPQVEQPEAVPVGEPAPAQAPAEPGLTWQQKLETEGYRWADKYADPDALEKGYENAIQMQNRTAERANAYNMRNRELAERNRKLEQALQQVAPYLRERMAAPPAPAPQPEPSPWPDEQQQQPAAQAPDPRLLAQYIDTVVTQRTAQAEAELRAQLAREAEMEEERRTVLGFFESKGISVESPEDSAMTQTVLSLNTAWEAQGIEDPNVNLADPQSLEVVYEATRDPFLRQVLEYHPEYFDSETGLQMARLQAMQLRGTPVTPTTTQVPASQVGQTVGQRKPVTERASAGASPQTRPNDEVAEAMLDYRRRHGLAIDSPFGV